VTVRTLLAADAGEVVQVVGEARAGDPTTLHARALAADVVRHGGAARLLCVDRDDGSWELAPSGPGLHLEPAGTVVVHTHDGGAALAPLVPALLGCGSRLTLVHHGSAHGSDRTVLRALHDRVGTAWTPGPVAADELARLGYPDVRRWPMQQALDWLASLRPDAATLAGVAAHPGPRLVAVGRLRPGAGVETLIDALSDLVLDRVHGAVLSLCGPAPDWYREELRRRLVSWGLRAVELASPTTEPAIRARLDHATAVVDLGGVEVDPYVAHAMAADTPVVTLTDPEDRAGLLDALTRALAPEPASAGPGGGPT
jgi:glycosyltransferase involved in cell wall biosynthesis